MKKYIVSDNCETLLPVLGKLCPYKIIIRMISSGLFIYLEITHIEAK